MQLEPWCTGSITSGWHHLGLESVFWSFLTKTRQDQELPSHVHGKIQPHSTQFWLGLCSISAFLGHSVNDHWSKKICRPQMIVDIRCYIHLRWSYFVVLFWYSHSSLFSPRKGFFTPDYCPATIHPNILSGVVSNPMMILQPCNHGFMVRISFHHRVKATIAKILGCETNAIFKLM